MCDVRVHGCAQHRRGCVRGLASVSVSAMSMAQKPPALAPWLWLLRGCVRGRREGVSCNDLHAVAHGDDEHARRWWRGVGVGVGVGVGALSLAARGPPRPRPSPSRWVD
jgi:hypothetical protein